MALKERLDSRLLRLRTIWGLRTDEDPEPANRFTASNTVRAAYPASQQRGQQWYVASGRHAEPGTFTPITAYGETMGAGILDTSGILAPTGEVVIDGRRYGFGISRNGGSALSKHGVYREFVIASAGQTHTIRVNLMAGGYIDYWRVQIPGAGIDTQILNRGDCYNRGIQVSAHWVDAYAGNLRRHHPAQGGSIYSQASGAAVGDAYTSWGSPVVSVDRVDGEDGSTTLKIVSCMLEYDPAGELSTPGVSSSQACSRWEPAIWLNVFCQLKLTINQGGVEGRHRVEASVWFPWDVQTGFFDASVQAPLFLDAGVFNNIRCYDTVTDADSLVSNGVLSTAYFLAQYRRYGMRHGVGIWGDDEGLITGTPLITSGRGVLAGHATASGLAVGVFSDIRNNPIDPDGDQYLRRVPRGTCFTWAQNRGDANGQDGLNAVMVSTPAELSNRWFSSARRRIQAGHITNSFYVLTDTWANVKTLAEGVPA